MAAVAADNDAVLVASDRACTSITYQGDWLSADTKLRGTCGDHLPAMRGWIANSDDVFHFAVFVLLVLGTVGRSRIEPIRRSHNAIASASLMLGVLAP